MSSEENMPSLKTTTYANAEENNSTTQVAKTRKKVYWLPLESNPAMLNEFAYRIGMDKKYAFNDVWGLDISLLAMLPRPCFALTLLFNTSDKIKEFKAQQQKEIEEKKVENKVPTDDKLFYMKQYVGNACGTIATLHSIANAGPIRESLAKGSPISKFFDECKGKNEHERGNILGEADYLSEASDNSATNSENAQTSAPSRGDTVTAHFIAFVPCDGYVYELDGGKAFPICHGPIGDDFVQTASQVIQSKFMAVDPDSYQWNIMALCEGSIQ
jgi:ubiquitin carboxyl-terminal hydrolase L3